MRTVDRMTGFIAMVLGAWVWVAASRMEYEGLYGPGPGFLPFWLGLSLMLAGLVIVGGSFGPRGPLRLLSSVAGSGDEPVELDRPRAARVGLAVAALVASVWLFQIVGFVVSFALFVATLLLVLDRVALPKAAAVALGLAVGLWAIFDRALGVSLPMGALGTLLGIG